MPTPIATLNLARGVWETNQGALCGHLVPYLETWPAWGMTRSGVAYALPTWAPHMDGSGSLSLLPTPDAYDGTRGSAQPPMKRRLGGHSVSLQDVASFGLLPTPTAETYGTQHAKDETRQTVHSLQTMASKNLLPTPTARDHKDGTPVDAVEDNALLGRVVWSIGDDTARQSRAGKQPPDSEHPHLLSPDAVDSHG